MLNLLCDICKDLARTSQRTVEL